MKEYKTVGYKKIAGTWDIPLLIDKIVEVATAQWLMDADRAAKWLEYKYKNPIDPEIRSDIIQEAQKRLDQDQDRTKTRGDYNNRHPKGMELQ